MYKRQVGEDGEDGGAGELDQRSPCYGGSVLPGARGVGAEGGREDGHFWAMEMRMVVELYLLRFTRML